jgi:hypothetical protein
MSDKVSWWYYSVKNHTNPELFAPKERCVIVWRFNLLTNERSVAVINNVALARRYTEYLRQKGYSYWNV